MLMPVASLRRAGGVSATSGLKDVGFSGYGRVLCSRGGLGRSVPEG